MRRNVTTVSFPHEMYWILSVFFPKLITFSLRSRSLWSSRCAMYDSGSGAAKALEIYFIKNNRSFLCLSLSLPLPVFLSVGLTLKTSISNFLSQSTDGVRPLSILSSFLLRVFMCEFSLCISDTITLCDNFGLCFFASVCDMRSWVFFFLQNLILGMTWINQTSYACVIQDSRILSTISFS